VTSRARAAAAPVTTEWVTVYSGSRSAALVVQTALEARGIPTYLPDEQMKVIDPFITGSNPFDVRLQVPSDLVREAREVLPPPRAPSVRAVELRDADEARADDVRRLAQRLAWCLVFPIFGWLFGVALGFRYLRAAAALPERPVRHCTTLVIWLAQAVLLAGWMVAQFSRGAGPLHG
jgi:hypothetical protein